VDVDPEPHGRQQPARIEPALGSEQHEPLILLADYLAGLLHHADPKSVIIHEIAPRETVTCEVETLKRKVGSKLYEQQEDFSAINLLQKNLAFHLSGHVLHSLLWKNLSPRFGVSYDLFGDGKTAIKGSVSKYVSKFATDNVNAYNPMFLASDSRTWNDLNRDDIAQDNEIGPSNNNAFGIRPSRNPDPNLKREYSLEYTAVFQRQLTRGISASVGYYRRGFHRLQQQDNLLQSPGDYTPVTIASPLNGEPVTVYNLNRAKQGLVDILDINTVNDARTQTYNGLEVSGQARIGEGRLIGGWTHDRTVIKNCSLDDPNSPIPTGALADTTGGRFCDETRLGLPFLDQFKLSGAYPLWWGIQLSGVLTSYPGRQLFANYTVDRTIIPALTQTSVLVPLIKPGTKYADQWNQLDLGFAKVVTFNSTRNVRFQVDVFNSLNANTILNQNFNYGPALDRPTEILQGRVVRLGAQLHF
jgi:hypothetical protein